MAGTDCDGECVELRAAHKVCRLLWVGQQLIHRQLAIGTVTVFFVAFHGFERTQTAQLTLDRDA